MKYFCILVKYNWASTSLCGKELNYKFNFLNRYMSKRSIYVYLSEVGIIYQLKDYMSFNGSLHFICLKFIGIELFLVYPYYPFNVCIFCSKGLP